MIIQPFFDKTTATISYIVSDETTQCCAIIDSVLNFTPESGKTTTTSADSLIAYVRENNLKVQWILETHLHADHLTAASYLKSQLGGKIGIGNQVIEAIHYWTNIFNTQDDTPKDGSQFDMHFKDNDIFNVGTLKVTVLHTPGHTPICVSYLIEDAIFVGDTLFMPYMGTSRTDFPGGDAKTLYHSIQRILSLPTNTRIFTGHDYPPEGQELGWESAIEEQKKHNILINDNITEAEYIAIRTKRDSSLPVPRLLIPAIQINLRAGGLGKTVNGRQYLHIPLNTI
jgi:glyoxylase-like metal-dependent hydrolase (beta-lactamase superfamily II)